MAREVPMEFTCHTTYDQKALTAMARAVRKTIRRRRAARKYDRLHRDESWRQILAIK